VRFSAVSTGYELLIVVPERKEAPHISSEGDPE
jgi:hypothetical protein